MTKPRPPTSHKQGPRLPRPHGEVHRGVMDFVWRKHPEWAVSAHDFSGEAGMRALYDLIADIDETLRRTRPWTGRAQRVEAGEPEQYQRVLPIGPLRAEDRQRLQQMPVSMATLIVVLDSWGVSRSVIARSLGISRVALRQRWARARAAFEATVV